MDGKIYTCSVKSAKIVPMIRTESEVGTGTQKDPVRMAFQYWDLNGKLLFIDDDYQSEI